MYLLCKVFQDAFYCTDSYLQGEKGTFSIPVMKSEDTFHFTLFWHCNISFPYVCIGWEHRTSMSNHLKAAPLRRSKRSKNPKGINLKLRYGTALHTELVSFPLLQSISLVSFLRQSTLIRQFWNYTSFNSTQVVKSTRGSSVLAFQTWHKRETCSGLRLPVLTRWAWELLPAHWSATPLYLPQADAKYLMQIKVISFWTAAESSKNHKFLKLTAVAVT